MQPAPVAARTCGAVRPPLRHALAPLAGLLAIALALIVTPTRAQLTSQEERGRQLYLQGAPETGPASFARLGRAGTRIPASAVPCGNCHGADGRGRPEGGVSPPDVTWGNLTKAYGHRHADGRSHPPYEEASLARALTHGLDPAGNPLDFAMPRYGYAADDVAALIAYLKKLGLEGEQGITDTAIILGISLADETTPPPIAASMRATLLAVFARVNKEGGIYRRHIETVNATAADRVFAVIGHAPDGPAPDGARADDGMPAMPVIIPFPLSPDATAAGNRFFIFPEIPLQLAVLAKYWGERNPGAIAAVSEAPAAAAALRQRIAELHLSSRLAAAPLDASGLAAGGVALAELRRKGVKALIIDGGPGLLRRVSEATAALNWFPDLLLSAQSAGEGLAELPAGFGARVLVAFPNLPSLATEAGEAEFRAVLSDANVPIEYLAAQIAAYAAAKVTVEGLRRSGRQLTRQAFVTAIEGISGYQTGLTPPLSFGRSRRSGSRGVFVLTYDAAAKAIRPDDTWLPLD
jgi:hypothetical protein